MLMFLLSTTLALAEEAPRYPVTLVGATVPQLAFGGQQSYGFALEGRALIHAKRLSLDFAGSEGYAALRQRHLGSIFIGARLPMGELFYARGGFYHQHEATVQLLMDEPVSTLAGVAEDIDHRSGAQLALGLDRPWDRVMDDPVWGRFSNGAELSLAYFPDSQGPHLYLGLAITGAVRVGSPRPESPPAETASR